MDALVINYANHNKKAYGQVMRRGFGTITLCVTDKHGSKGFKTFKEDKWIVHLMQEVL